MGIDQGSRRCAPHQGPRTVQSQIEFGRTNFRFAECSMSIGLQALLGGENPSNAGRVFLSGTGAFSPPRVFAHNSAHHQEPARDGGGFN